VTDEQGSPGLADQGRLAGGGPAPLLEVLHGIFAATLQPDSWPLILRMVAPVFGTAKSLFFQVDRVCPSASVTEGIGLAPAILQALRERNLDEDYMWQAALRLPAGAVFRSGDLHPSQVLYRGPLYERIAVPGGIEHVLSANLENTPAYFSNICFLRADEGFTEAAKEALAQIVPHLQAALQIARRIALGDSGRREALMSFDRAHQPLVVLDRSGYAIYCNEPARCFLEQSGVLTLKFGRFLFDNVAMQGEFERAVRIAVAGADSNGEVPPPQRLRVSRQPPAAPIAISVVPARRPNDRALLPEGAGCMVLMTGGETLAELPVKQLVWLYRLTAAEGKICAALYNHGSIEATAERLHLTQHTVRSHLKSIYAKFGVSSQGQLMARLARSVALSEGIQRPDALQKGAR
jgi:DNA-binding CsgD family transcriptional regulator